MRGKKRKNPYEPKQGWFDLSKLNLPKWKFDGYAELQELGQHYHETYEYQKTHNAVQLFKLKEMVAEMDLDLILNYNALEICDGPPKNAIPDIRTVSKEPLPEDEARSIAAYIDHMLADKS